MMMMMMMMMHSIYIREITTAQITACTVVQPVV